MERTELRPAEADLPFVQLAFANEIERGELVHILPKWQGSRAHFYAVYPSRKHVPVKTRAFLEFLQATVGKDRMKPPEAVMPDDG